MDRTLGLIAGGGRLPLLQAHGMRAAGHRVACIGLADQYDPDLPAACDQFAEAGLIRLGKWIRLFRRWNVQHAVIVGLVQKARVHEPMRLLRQMPDWRAAHLWYRVLRHDKRDQTILAAVADELAHNGVHLLDTTRYIQEHLAHEGVMTRRQPSSAQWADIRFAWPILMRMSDLDVGQSIAVKELDIVAVEALEGTDQMIARAGQLCRTGGWTLLKGAHASKDFRFDVPTVGPRTIENLAKAGARCLVLAAGRVIMADKPAVIAAADRHHITIIGLNEQSDL